MKPSMSIGRNYRLELEKRLRKVNQSREKTKSLKILDDHRHLIKPPINSMNNKNKKKDEIDTKSKSKKSSGVVPLMVKILLCQKLITVTNHN